VTLNESNWESTLIKSEGIWLVEFYAPWCGHCKDLEPKWRKAAEKLKGNVTLAKIDVEENKKIAERYGIKSFPTIKVFGQGRKSVERAYTYNGERKVKDIVAFGNELYSDSDKQDDWNIPSGNDLVVDLFDHTFNKTVMKS
jgi:protein disulfide-isomerase A6